MKKIFLAAIIIALANHANSQTLIATSTNINATKNHNQRKIVRDNDHHIFVFYQDFNNDTSCIKSVVYDSLASQWSDPEFIAWGSDPAIAIGPTDSLHLIYRSNDPNSRIMLMTKIPGGGWLPAIQISNADSLQNILPVADVNIEGIVLAAWIEQGEPDDKVILNRDGISIEIYSADSLTDISLSTPLLDILTDKVFLALGESATRVKFFSIDSQNELDLILDTLGTKPCQSIGVYAPGYSYELCPRYIYIDQFQNISNFSPYYWQNYPYTLVEGPVTDVAIDDVLMPVGFDFLYSDENGFYNAFTGQDFYTYVIIIDTLSQEFFNFSIAYKHFSPIIVDFIWMQDEGDQYGVYYKRSNKIPYNPGVGIKVNSETDVISLWISSNPFKDQILVNVFAKELKIPVVKFYDLSGRLIKTIDDINDNGNFYSFTWYGKNDAGNSVKAGTYILNITLGKHTLNNMIVKE